MTAVTVSQADHASSAANAWLIEHHDEIRSRATACFAHWEPGRREEAVAETIATVAAAAHRAATSGKLDQLTVYHCVVFASRHVRGGRRMAGYSSTDATSEATRIKHRIRVVSLDRDGGRDDEIGRPFSDLLADRDAADPAEVARRNIDYGALLAHRSLSAKAKAVFLFLATTHASGKQADLATELMISPGRITQLKTELAKVLAQCGYHGPLGPRAAR